MTKGQLSTYAKYVEAHYEPNTTRIIFGYYTCRGGFNVMIGAKRGDAYIRSQTYELLWSEKNQRIELHQTQMNSQDVPHTVCEAYGADAVLLLEDLMGQSFMDKMGLEILLETPTP